MVGKAEVIDLVAVVTAEEEETYAGTVDQLHKLCLGEDGGRHTLLLVDCGDGVHEMTAGRALVNLALLYPYRIAGVTPAPHRFIRTALDSDLVAAHLNETIAELYETVEHETLSLAAAGVTNFLADLAVATTGRVGTSLSIKALIDAGRQDQRVWDLLHWQTPAGELNDIEKAADAAGSELVTRLRALPGEIGRLLRSGAAINKDQMRQAFVSVGIKPGLGDGELIPEPIDSSFLRGMRGVEDFYICAIGARKALTTNFKQVKASGYLARKLVLLVANHFIDPDLEDCDTIHGIRTIIQSHDHVGRVAGRLVRMPGEDVWRYPHEEELSDLIETGKPVTLRSPMTCAGQIGACHACYGKMARANTTIHAGVYGALVISEQIIQRLLSSKHLLKARPVVINWPEEFLKSFIVERAAVIVESNVERIFIKTEDLEEDEDEGVQMTNAFYYRVAGERGRLKITPPVPIYLDSDAWGSAEVEDGEISIMPSHELPVFQVPVSNTDLSEALHAIFSLLERGTLPSLHDMYASLIELLTRSEIRTPSVHAEMILRALIRDAGDHMKRPDFSSFEEPNYEVVKLTPAILASPSITNSLAFERVKGQLTSPDVLRKTQSGALDALFGG